MEVVQPVQPPQNGQTQVSGMRRWCSQSFRDYPSPVSTYGQGYFIPRSQRWREVRLTSYMNSLRMWDSISSLMRTTGGMEQKWVQKIICKSPVDKKPSPPCLISRHRWGNICYGSLSHTGKWAEASVGAAWQLDISSVQYCFSPILVDTIILSIS